MGGSPEPHSSSWASEAIGISNTAAEGEGRASRREPMAPWTGGGETGRERRRKREEEEQETVEDQHARGDPVR